MPYSEQIVNGGFETGDFTGWIVYGESQIISNDKHSGTYSCLLNGYDMKQDVYVRCGDISICGFWFKNEGDYAGGCILHFEGGTWSVIDCPPSPNWVFVDLLSIIHEQSDDEVIIDIYFYDQVADLYASILKIDDISLIATSPPTPISGETLRISNANGTLWCKPLKWKESQYCKPAIRPLPLASSEYLDADTWVLKPRTLEFEVRLSDDEKDIFESIYNYASISGVNQYTHIYLYYNSSSYVWNYTVWIAHKNYKWKYSLESGEIIRWWYATITCNVKDFSGSDDVLPLYPSSDVTIDGHTLDFIIDFERDDKHPPMLPEWINQTEAVDSYLWNECVLDIAYTCRMTNAEKWVMDITLRNHVKVAYEDYIHNLYSAGYWIEGELIGIWVSSIEAEWDDTNWAKPWKITISIQANNSEIETDGGGTP